MIGPPGSGKGTQAHLISEICNIPIIITGDMLREAVSNGTKYGKIAEQYMDKGDLVPDEIVNSMVRERLNKPDAVKGFILDGFPRNTPQADALDKILHDKHRKLDYVIHIILDDESIINRLSRRRICSKCGAIYHLKNNPPKEDCVCNVCGLKLIQRDDDTPEVIKKRLEVYKEKTKPLLERYKKMDIVIDVPGNIDLNKLPGLLRNLLD